MSPTPTTQFRAGAVGAWLIAEAGRAGGPRALLDELCPRLIEAGLPLVRATFNLQTLHPQMLAQSFTWWRGQGDAVAVDHSRGGETSPEYLDSPVAAIHGGAGGVRCRLDADPPQLDYPLMHELKAMGVTDYVMMPQTFSDGVTNGVSWSTDRPGGFTTEELGEIYELLPLIALLLELSVARKIATTVLETYIGKHAASRVLAGEITRGSGHTMRAVLWYCDLRDFTALSESRPRDELIELLNDFFECMTAPVHASGGEVLKFMGDGMLAIFPCGAADACDACRNALKTAATALAALDALNRRRAAAGKPILEAGLALHLGDVMYGNIGAPDRLDFTVIGPAVNEVARVERFCRKLGRPLLVTAAVAAESEDALVSVGRFELRGVSAAQELFTLPAYAQSARAAKPAG
ncbi:MAG: adenylate/guanylate cyclase domain-containing protein [Proteobacteria bacterium]|nr:adenylate/guanylate cyclase domain-containing protein [Pseudomonadota bacterium]MCH7931877.1 adenylate/guanylate cyclase domain-containing protein [Pseudomonadota bacterium]